MIRKGKERLLSFFRKISWMKLKHRMMVLYLIGGALPMIAIGMYLITGTRRLLVDQAKTAEAMELRLARNQFEEILDTVNTVSKYFLFDEGLEKIAATQYEDYQEMVDDFRNYGAFTQYGKYYNNLIGWTSVYLENDSLRGNAHFVKVDDEIREETWYQRALQLNGVGGWQYVPQRNSISHEKGLALTRLLKTKKGETVGVLVLHVRSGRLEEIIRNRTGDAMLVLNREELLTQKEGSALRFSEVQKYLSGEEEIHQEKIVADGRAYLLTCANISQQDTPDTISLVSLRSYEEILSGARRQNQSSIVMFVFFAGLSTAMILIFSQSFGARVERFHREMQKAASGNFDLVKDLGGRDEISELYSYLGTMIYEIQKLLAEIYREKIHAEQLRSEQKEAEFQMLASQINPHFLYNTLETIRMTARVHKEYDIEHLVKLLAKILRKSIRSADGDVMLGTEIELIECYLEIQKYRFGERIQYEIHADDGLERQKVLPLLIQPLVENSIIHGLEVKEGVGHIRISICRAGEEELCITVEDDGIGMEEEQLLRLRREMNSKAKGNGHIGVGNVYRRVRLRYGEPYGLELDSRAGQGTCVKIRLPQEMEERQIRDGGSGRV